MIEGQIIDTPYNIEDIIDDVRAAGVHTVIRYYNRQNTKRFPDKRLTRAEAEALSDAGLSVMVVFQQNHRDLADFTEEMARKDAAAALKIAVDEIGQPSGSTIYVAVDYDFFRPSELKVIESYFRIVRADLTTGKDGRSYKVGVYGSGTVATRLLDADGGPLVDHVWIPRAMGWSGTRDFLRGSRWHLFQDRIDLVHKGIGYDANSLRPGVTDIGAFRIADAVIAATPRNAAIFEVSVRGSLNLRGGPGTEFPVQRSLANGTRLYGLERQGAWVKVDMEGDGVPDGFVHEAYLKPVTNTDGLPTAGRSALDIALAELERGVREVPGTAVSPQIQRYYRHLDPDSNHNDDTVHWCSYFMNYCIEQAGGVGTRRANARSWATWGRSVRPSPRRGDVAVFWRGSPTGWEGHVGFWWDETEDGILVLGGNQGDAVSIRAYPKKQLLDIRRG